LISEWQARRRLGRPQADPHQPAAPRHDPGARAGRLPERRRLRDAVFGVVAVFLGDDAGWSVAKVEAVKDDWNERDYRPQHTRNPQL